MEWKLQKPNPEEARKYFENKMTFTLGPIEVKYYLDQGETPVLVDVRAQADFEEGHVPGAINLPEDKWETLAGLRHDRPNIVYCYSVVCHLGAKAATYFTAKGFPVLEMDGGFEYWEDYGLEIEKGASKREEAEEEFAPPSEEVA